MKKTINHLNNLVVELQKHNPNVSWNNIGVGFFSVMFTMSLSVFYFNKIVASASAKDNVVVLDSVSQSNTGNNLSLVNSTSLYGNPLQSYLNGKNSTNDVLGIKEINSQKDELEYTLVLPGEGLWNVAERVCNNGEAYTMLAQANGLPYESFVNPGQKLLVKCK